MPNKQQSGMTCECVLCKNNHEFEISKELMNEILTGNVTIFAGAGISTESRNVLNFSFYESIESEIQNDHTSMSFPELMEEYCRQPNGRYKLLAKIKERFNLIDSFPELTRVATQFHQELSTLFPIKNIITTNWDTYFEQYCGATPFVTDQDLAFWEVAPRRVLKIHGSISNLGSVVATTTDYKQCSKRLNSEIIGGLLKTILATQTVIFIGYSLSDSDFTAIYEFVKKQMNSLHKQAYIVTPVASDCEKFKAMGLLPIHTDGTYFISTIKTHATSQGILLKDDIYKLAEKLFDGVLKEHSHLHKTIKASKYPGMIYAAFYQDGMIHALSRMINMRSSGTYSNKHKTVQVIHSYLKIKKEKLKNGKYEDVAYIDGYVNALMYFLFDEDEQLQTMPPLYYLPRSKSYIATIAAFKNELRYFADNHKAANKRASRIVNMVSNPNSIEYHHPPWL